MGSRAQTGRVIAQRYEHSRYENSDTVKMAAVSTNGHTNMEGMKVKGQEEFREEDGYFTCAVSVQHKKHDFETSSAYSASDSEHARKVVWPANQAKLEKQAGDASRTFQNTFKQSTSQADQQHKWLNMNENEEVEKKTAFEMRQSSHRISRSNSRSKNIMDRARSFERAAAESRGNSRPASRTGSIGGRHRSPSGNRGQVEEMWMNQLERPSSRTDVDSRRFGEIGRVQTAEWEGRIKGSTENLPTRTPPPKRKELNMKRNPDLERGFDTKTPEPPPPPTRMTYPPNTIKEPECEFPPPPESDTKSKLSEESVGQISEENKENIVKQWVESTTQSAEEIAKELEKFAYDIAETVVSNMEKNSEKKESFGSQSHQSTAATSAFEQTQKTQPGGGLYFAAPVSTTHRELHGPVYVQEDNRRVGMTFQQEERRREELRKQEEAKQEEKRKLELELEAQRLQEEQQRKLVEMRRAQEEEMRRQEEAKRLEMERQQLLALQRQEEEKKRQAEIEEKKRQEERRRQEEERLRQQELKMIEEEMRRQYEMQQQMQRQKEQQLLLEQQQLEVQRQKEQQLLLEKQQMEVQRQREQQFLLQQQQMEQQRIEMERQKEQQLLQEQQRINQDTIGVRDHIPKVSKTKSFEASQDRQNELKTEDHLSLIKTGQVNEKRNFWMRST